MSPTSRPQRGARRGAPRVQQRDVTYTLAHYYTYLDVPGIRFRLPGAVQLPGEPAPTNVARFGNEIQAIERFPRRADQRRLAHLPDPSWYSVVRSEAAYFQGEPMNRQGRDRAPIRPARRARPRPAASGRRTTPRAASIPSSTPASST